MKSVGLAVLALVLFLGLGWVFMGNDLAMRKVFAPAHEQVRRETFEQSKAYQQGMVQDLRNMQFAYVQADSEHKAALASVIRHRFADYPTDQLPADLRQFLKEIQ
jgi:type VI protein secretion system component VasK